MSDPPPRIPLADPDRLRGEQKAQYEPFPSNLTRALLLLDDRLAHALPESANALRGSMLDDALREAAILRVAARTDSANERMQHLGQATKAGWSDEPIAAIESSSEEGLDARTHVTLRLVEALLDAHASPMPSSPRRRQSSARPSWSPSSRSSATTGRCRASPRHSTYRSTSTPTRGPLSTNAPDSGKGLRDTGRVWPPSRSVWGLR